MELDERTILLHRYLTDVIHKDDHVRIAHADVGALELLADGLSVLLHLNGDGLPLQTARGSGYLLRMGEARLAHIYGGTVYLPGGIGMQRDVLDARECVEVYLRLVREVVVIDILAHTAGTVAAHHGFGAIGIENAHHEVGHLAAADEDEAIRTNARVVFAPAYGELLWILDRVEVGVDVDVVIAQTLHFGEFYHKSMCEVLWFRILVWPP